MNFFKVEITEENHKKRLDKALAELASDYSRNRLQSLIKGGQVQVNKNIVKDISYKISTGDEIEFNIPETISTDIKPAEHIKIDIVYEDEDLLVINKQAGLTVHPGAGNFDDTLVNALVAKLGENLSGINGEKRPGIVHRLDRDTTGLMLVAKNDNSHQFLSEAIEYREVVRIYHALVWNKPELPIGKIKANIGRSPKDRTKMAVVKRSGKEAITHYKQLKTYFNGTLSLIECKLQTGRTHQIRVHMEHKKMPLIGDQSYYGNKNYKKSGSLNKEIKETTESFSRQALHARYIEFEHPTSGEIMQFEQEYPNDIKILLEKLEDNKD